MTDNEKSGNSNLIIFGLGIVAMFFAYLIYVKSKESPTQPVLQPIQIPQIQPIQPITQSVDSLELYKISEQLKLQNDQIQSIQAQQTQQMQNINQIESTKCSNVVSMNDGTYPSLNNLSKFPSKTNIRRENEDEIANRIFGMK